MTTDNQASLARYFGLSSQAIIKPAKLFGWLDIIKPAKLGSIRAKFSYRAKNEPTSPIGVKKSRVKDDESRTTSESPMLFKKISERFITQCVEGGSTPGSLWLDTGLIITGGDSSLLSSARDDARESARATRARVAIRAPATRPRARTSRASRRAGDASARARPGSTAHCYSYPNVRNRRRMYARRA